MAGIGVIINPFSKHNRKLKDPETYYRNIAGNDADIRVTGSLDDILPGMRDFLKKGISYLAISGGDGSLHHVISGLINVYGDELLPSVLLLRDGSMNNIAKSYSLKGKSRELLTKLIGSVRNNERLEIVYRDTIKAGNKYCFLFGLGLVADYISEFNRGNKKGPGEALKIMFKFLPGLFTGSGAKTGNLNGLSVFVDGKKLDINNFIAIYAATVHTLAFGFNPASKAYEKDGSFHLIASGLEPKKFIMSLNKFRKGKAVTHPEHFDGIATELRIVRPGEFIFQMDGDVYKAKDELLVETGPRIGFVKV